jgi:Tol biopolymer transport system component/DNA-binding winged helix-turn-helix (wHTH) protein
MYAFGPFLVDPDERVVLRDGQPVPLTPKAIAILLALLARHGHIVDKAELMQAVWPDTAVEEANLTQNVYSLRKTLGSRTESGVVIETVPRRGYRLVGDISLTETPKHAHVGAAVAAAGLHSTSQPHAQLAAVASDGVPPTAARHTSWQRRAVVAGLVLIISAISYGTASLLRQSAVSRPIQSAVPSLVTRLVNSLPGEKLHPALSPDADRVAFIWNRGDGHNLYVASPSGESTLQLTRGPGGKAYPAWAPDGQSLAFIHRFIDQGGRAAAGVFIVAATGGPVRTLWLSGEHLIGSGLDWSPDGAHLALSVKRSAASDLQIVLLSVADGSLSWLTTPTETDIGDSYPVFSPGGSSLAFVRNTKNGSRIMVLPLNGRPPRLLAVNGHNIRSLAWTADEKALLFASMIGRQLWKVSLHNDHVEPLSGLGEGVFDPSVARRRGLLIFRQIHADQNMYRVHLGADGSLRSLPLAATSRYEGEANISPDASRIVFVSSRTGPREVWVMLADGSAPRQLSDIRTGANHPRWSPDGRFIAFTARAADSTARHIYVLDATDGLTRRLTWESSNDTWASWSHDGKWIYFTSNRGGVVEIWKVPHVGGQPEPVTRGGGVRAAESSDGRFLYYSTQSSIWRQPLAGGERTHVMHLPRETAWGGEWVLTSRGIYWINEELKPQPSIDFYDFSNQRSTLLLALPEIYDSGAGFSISPDGNWLVFGQRDYQASDIVIAEGL